MDFSADSLLAPGAIGVFLLMVPESACLPIPSEVTLMAAGFAVHDGRMSLWLAVLAATAGNLAGSLLAYGIGRAGVLRGLGRTRRGARALERCEELFDRHGTRAVLIARLLPLARTFVSVPAGHARVPLGRFVSLTTLGCAVWALAFVLAGMLAGESWQLASRSLGPVLLGLGALILGGLGWWAVRSRDRPEQESAGSGANRG